MFQGGLFFLGFLAALLLIIINLSAVLRGRMALRSAIIWFLLALAIIILSLSPQTLDVVAGLFNVEQVRGLFLITVGLLTAFMLIYANSSGQADLRRKMRQLNQEIGLLRYEMEYYGRKGDDDASRRDNRDSE